MSLKVETKEEWKGSGSLRLEEGANRASMLAAFEASRASLRERLGKQGGHVSPKLMRHIVDDYLRPHWFARVRGFHVPADAEQMDMSGSVIGESFHYRIGVVPGADDSFDAGTSDAEAARDESGKVRPRFRAILMAGAECGSCDGTGEVSVDCDAPGCAGHDVPCCGCDGEGKIEAAQRDVYLADVIAALPPQDAGSLEARLHEMIGRQLVMEF